MGHFGLMIDVGRKRLQWNDSQCTRVRQGDGQGHYLLNLAEDPMRLREKIRAPEFRYAAREDDYSTGKALVGESTGQSEVPEHARQTNDEERPADLNELSQPTPRGLE